MVDDQHKLIKGYRDLSEAEIAEMNEAKRLANEVGTFINHLENRNTEANGYDVDRRWLNIARTDLQKGFMSLVRSIAKPGGY